MKTTEEYAHAHLNYLRVIDSEADAANSNKISRKDHQIGKIYLYTNQLN